MRARYGRGDRRGEQIAALADVGGLIQRTSGRAHALDDDVKRLVGGNHQLGLLRGGNRQLGLPLEGPCGQAPYAVLGLALGPVSARLALGEGV